MGRSELLEEILNTVRSLTRPSGTRGEPVVPVDHPLAEELPNFLKEFGVSVLHSRSKRRLGISATTPIPDEVQELTRQLAEPYGIEIDFLPVRRYRRQRPIETAEDEQENLKTVPPNDAPS